MPEVGASGDRRIMKNHTRSKDEGQKSINRRIVVSYLVVAALAGCAEGSTNSEIDNVKRRHPARRRRR